MQVTFDVIQSTSGGAVTIGEHTIKAYCRQQKVVALSSAEAELYAMVAASAEALAVQAYAKDLGINMGVEMYADSSAALGIAKRAGIGKVRNFAHPGPLASRGPGERTHRLQESSR